MRCVLFLCSECMYFVELFLSEGVDICWDREVIEGYEDRDFRRTE